MDHFLIGKTLFDKTMSLLERSLDVRTSRHQVLSGNVANAETPKYVAKDLPFRKILEQSVENSYTLQLKKTHAKHFPEDQSLYRDFTSEIEPTGKEVSIDEEMAKLAENHLMFQAGAQALMKKLEALKSTIADLR